MIPEERRMYTHVSLGVFELDDSQTQCNWSHLKTCGSYSWSTMEVYERWSMRTFPGKIPLFPTENILTAKICLNTFDSKLYVTAKMYSDEATWTSYRN